MIVQIYGVKILPSGEKERRYFGDIEESGAQDAMERVVLVGCNYAYAKQIGAGIIGHFPPYREELMPQLEPPAGRQANQG